MYKIYLVLFASLTFPPLETISIKLRTTAEAVDISTAYLPSVLHHPNATICQIPNRSQKVTISILKLPMGSADMSEPDRKRVRFDKPTKEAPASDAAPSDSEKKSTLRANDVVQLRFLLDASSGETLSAANPHPPHLTTRPTYLHQIIPNEEVHGWSDLTVAVYIHLPTLYIWIDQAGTEAHEDRTDVSALLIPFVKHGLYSTRAQFLTAIASVPPLPLLNCVATYKRNGEAYAVFKESFYRTVEDGAIVKDIPFHNFHLRMAFLMFIHIDGASFIDHDDPRWEVFVSAKLTDGKPNNFVGYATIYPFSALTKRNGAHATFSERIRISQVFVSPLAQSSGHGSRLLSAVYSDAGLRNAMEITVEDPSSSFRVLRDVTDLKRCYVTSILDPSQDFNSDAEPTMVEAMRTKLLLTGGQARRCLEVHRLRYTNRKDETAYKRYRLWVKRRLYTENVEVLDQFEKDEKKEKLGEIYSNYEEEYLEAIKRLEASLNRTKQEVERESNNQTQIQQPAPVRAPQEQNTARDEEMNLVQEISNPEQHSAPQQ